MSTEISTLSQFQAVRQAMSDGKRHTLQQLAERVSALTGKRATESGVSARLRDLRKAPHNYTVVRTSDGQGGYLYNVSEFHAAPARPITYGEAVSSAEPTEAVVAGGRSALAYAETLSGNLK